EVIEKALAGEPGPEYDRIRSDLQAYYGKPLYDELSGLASHQSRAAAVRGGPRILILPGIMGSTLGYRRQWLWDDVIWVDPLDSARGRLVELKLGTATSGRIRALGAFSMTYLALKLRL